jgi:hypothetical protein
MPKMLAQQEAAAAYRGAPGAPAGYSPIASFGHACSCTQTLMGASKDWLLLLT